jgi:hypothetical protein
MAIMNIDDYVLALVGGRRIPNTDDIRLAGICGTAFAIGEGVFVTAKHVLDSIAEYDESGVGRVHDLQLQRHPIIETHAIPDLDISLFRADVPGIKLMKWQAKMLPLLHDVETAGFPFALQDGGEVFTVRAMKGHIVARSRFSRLPPLPWYYELSFQAARGLSGAPLWAPLRVPSISGVVIGNQSTEMVVFAARERLVDDRETIVERYEAMQVGVALQTEALLGITSPFFAGTLWDHLERQGLIEPLSNRGHS